MDLTSRMPIVRTNPQLGWSLFATGALLVIVAVVTLVTLPADGEGITLGQTAAILSGVPGVAALWATLKPQGWTYAFGYND